MKAFGIGCLLLLCAGAASGQIYKWVDAKGVTHYSDAPPPPSAGKVPLKVLPGAAAPALPWELAQAIRNNPVTLYTGARCVACDQGRALLQARGVPFGEKTVKSGADLAVLKQAGSAGQVPLLLVGDSKLIGFDAAAWTTALAGAAYPLQPMLPPGFQNPPALPAAGVAPARQPDSDAAATADDSREKLPPANTPPGFKF